MVSYICKSCGYTTNEEKAKYCQTCGSPLEPVGGDKCPKCNVDLATGAKFCSICGTPSGAAAGTPTAAPTPARPQVQAIITTRQREVTGPILKLMPIAHYLDKSVKVVGMIKLHRDGLRFSALNGELINCHIDEVARVSQGFKTDIMDVQMKDGKVFSFQVAGGKKWLQAFNDILRK